MKKQLALRIGYGCLVAASVMFFEGWLSLSLIFLGMLLFRSYYEGLFFALALDALFGVPLMRFARFPLLYTTLAFVVFIFVMYLKRVIKLYSRYQ